jgi:hypothetical protein
MQHSEKYLQIIINRVIRLKQQELLLLICMCVCVCVCVRVCIYKYIYQVITHVFRQNDSSLHAETNFVTKRRSLAKDASNWRGAAISSL